MPIVNERCVIKLNLGDNGKALYAIYIYVHVCSWWMFLYATEYLSKHTLARYVYFIGI